MLATATLTTVAWALIIFATLYFWPQGNGRVPMGAFYFCTPTNKTFAIFTWPEHRGDPSSAEWEPQGDSLIRLISSNATTSKSFVLLCYTAGPPERIQFQTALPDSPTNKGTRQ
jgi:hypothetical protein